MNLFSSMTTLIHRLSAGLWATLILSLVAVSWVAPQSPVTGSTGEGYVYVDIGVAVLLWFAVGAQTALRLYSARHRHDSAITQTSQWLMLATLCLITGRLTWVIWVDGDPHLAPALLVALISLALAVILHVIGRIIYDDDKSEQQPKLPPADPGS